MTWFTTRRAPCKLETQQEGHWEVNKEHKNQFIQGNFMKIKLSQSD